MASYRDELEAWAKTAGSDGCSYVPEFHRVCCLEHDHSYREGKTPRGVTVTKAQADQRFRDCIQRHSTLRWLSPMSWWRWIAVKQFGRGVWTTEPARVPLLLDVGAEASEARRRILREFYG